MEIFINRGLTNGLSSYVLKSNGRLYNNIYVYELYVIEVLVKIYGKINIINPYVTEFEGLFKNNLRMYGLSAREVDNFINAFAEYDIWLNSKAGAKTEAVSVIGKTLVKMIMLKNAYNSLSNDEIDFYDNYLLFKDKKIYNLVNVSGDSADDLIKFWICKRNVYLRNNVYVFNEVMPDYLSNTMYSKHGLKIEELEKLSNYKVNEINELINEAEKIPVSNKYNIFRTVITSGSGMVDSLILFSIVFTEIFIGFLIAIVGR